MFFKILVAILLAVGFYFVIGVSSCLPPWRTVKALEKLTGEKISFLDRIIFTIAHFIEPVIHLSSYRRSVLEKELRAAGEKVTPEFFTAVAVTLPGIYTIGALCLLPFYPIASAGIAIYAVRSYFKMRRVAESDVRREKIEAEAPRLTSYLVQSLPHRQDVVSMLQGYREVSGKELGSELDVLITDMRTSNPEAALINFESRINSPLVSELVRGLIGLEQGEDMRFYLQSVETRMNEREIAELKKEAEMRPEKLEPANWLLLGSVLLNFAVILGTQIFQNINIFGR